jgi:UPF0755 protein
MMDDLNFAFEDRDERDRRRRRSSSGRRSNNHPHGGGGGQYYPPQQEPYYPPPDPYRAAPQDPYYPPPQHNPYPGHADPGYQDPYYQGYPGYQQQEYQGYPGYENYDQYPPQQTRSQRNAKSKKKKKKKRSKLPLILGIVMLVCLGGGYLGYDKVMSSFIVPDYDGDGSGEVTVEIKPGASGTQMGKVLFDAGVVKSQKAFIQACDKNRDQADKIQPGTYKLRKEMKAETALFLLLDPKARLVSGITIPEGLSTFRIYKLLAEKLKLPEADFKTAAADPVALGVPATWFTRKDGKPVPATKSIEGFLFPDTYEFPPKVTAKEALTLMVKRFIAVTGELKFVDKFASDPKVSPYQALIVASLAQAEAGNKDDLGKVARVAYNRVYKRIPQLSCACLEMDVTVNYSLELAGKDPKTSATMTEKELTDPKNPYNRKADGLVPTPINNPGKQALQAAQTPPEGAWYWFVAIDKEGHSAFSTTFAQFCEDNKKAVAAGVLTKSSC